MKRLLALSAAAIVSSLASLAAAQNSPPDAAAPPISSEPQPGLWARGEPRVFLATTIDGGYLYLRPRITIGYGKPYWRWLGVDLNPTVTNNYLSAYGGLRFTIPHADLRLGARKVSPLQRNFLDKRDNYDILQLRQDTGDPASYYTLESELTLAIPAGPGSVLSVLTLTDVRGILADRNVYEETVRVITAGWFWRVRVGYGVRLGAEGNAMVGLVSEVIGLPGRSTQVYRAGMIGTFGISEHLEAILLIVIPVKSPDTIGIAGGDTGEFGLRYRWATGTRFGI